MKKNKLFALLASALFIGALTFGLSSFKEPAVRSALTTPRQPPCCCATPAGDITTSSDFFSANFNPVNYGNGTASFEQINLCYYPSATPPWYTNQYIGVIASAYRPSTTRTFSGYWPGTPSITVQFTLYSNGNLYMQQTGGTTMARNAQIRSAIYAL